MSTEYHKPAKKGIDWDEWGGMLIFIAIVVIVLLFIFWGNISSVLSGRGWDTEVATSCKDVTSYDRDWNNDMVCTRADGTTFYTDYAGAREAEAN